MCDVEKLLQTIQKYNLQFKKWITLSKLHGNSDLKIKLFKHF